MIADAVEEGRFIASRRGGARRRRPAPPSAPPRRRPTIAAAAGRGPPPGRPGRRRARGPPRRRATADEQSAVETEALAADEPAEPGLAAENVQNVLADASAVTQAEIAAEQRRRARRRPATAAAPPPHPRGGTEPMAEFTAKDVQALRQATGAGMMDAKKALRRTTATCEAASPVAAREGPDQGRQARATARTTRARSPSVVDGNVGAIVELKSETDFSAKADDFTSLVQDLAELVRGQGRRRRRRAGTTSSTTSRSPRRRTSSSARVVRFEAADGNVLDSYLHLQDGRGVNGVLVELAGGDEELAHEIALHIAFAKPPLPRPATRSRPTPSSKERQALLEHHQGEGKPEQALAQDRRGPPQRLVQGAGAARAGLRPATTRRPSPQLLGERHARPLRPGRHRGLRSWPPTVARRPAGRRVAPEAVR